MSASKSTLVKFGSAIALIVVCLSYLAWTGVQESKVYYVTIKELRSDPSAYSKRLRVAGNVEPGSIHKLGSTADFVLVELDPTSNERQTLRVNYKGTEPPPDTFKDNAQALVVGEFSKDGTFHAREIQAKCASKYAPQPGASTPSSSPAPSSAKQN